MRRARLASMLGLAGGGALALSALACGGGSTLPEAPPCAAPTPTATASPNRPFEVNQAYSRAVRVGVEDLAKLTALFRLRWPDGRFRSAAEFREDFVAYHANATCLAGHLRTLSPAGSRYTGFDERFDPVVADYLTIFEFGIEAVRKRNVSDYRSFNRRVDEVTVRLNEVVLTINQ